MKKWWFFLLILIVSTRIFSSSLATQTVTISIIHITRLALIGDDPIFEIKPDPTSSTFVTQVHSKVSYSFVCTQGCQKKIIAQLDMEMPQGMQLKVYLAAPSGAVSTGFQVLGVIESDLVTNIPSSSNAGNADIIYELSVDLSKTPHGVISRDIIYTFMDD